MKKEEKTVRIGYRSYITIIKDIKELSGSLSALFPLNSFIVEIYMMNLSITYTSRAS